MSQHITTHHTSQPAFTTAMTKPKRPPAAASSGQQSAPKAASAPRSITSANPGPIYAGTELQRAPGLTAGRFTALALPSRVSSRLYYPDGRIEVVA